MHICSRDALICDKSTNLVLQIILSLTYVRFGDLYCGDLTLADLYYGDLYVGA